jgi:DNA-binding transcriptional ArsR family regulator
MRRGSRRTDYDQLVSSLVSVVDRDRVVASDFADAAETLAMLGSPIRIHLLWVLSQGERDVTGLAEAIGASLATTSHHLRRMRAARVITSRADGRHQFYSVDDPHVVELIAQAVDHHADLRLRAAAPSHPAAQ